MRSFLGIPVQSEQLAKIQESLRAEGYHANPQVHFTLKFFGYISEKQIEEIHARLESLKFPSFLVQLNEINTFPHNRKVLWIGASSSKLIEMHEKVDELLQDIFPRDKRFTPHITVARSGSGFPVSLVRKYQEKFVAEEHAVKEVHLYESVLWQGHHKYNIIHSYKLQ